PLAQRRYRLFDVQHMTCALQAFRRCRVLHADEVHDDVLDATQHEHRRAAAVTDLPEPRPRAFEIARTTLRGRRGERVVQREDFERQRVACTEVLLGEGHENIRGAQGLPRASLTVDHYFVRSPSDDLVLCCCHLRRDVDRVDADVWYIPLGQGGEDRVDRLFAPRRLPQYVCSAD